jgi:hypothetical protein
VYWQQEVRTRRKRKTMPLVSVSQRKEDGTPLLGIGEEMILALPGVECHFDPSGPSEGPGSLYVTTKNVIWLSSQVCHSFLPNVVLLRWP